MRVASVLFLLSFSSGQGVVFDPDNAVYPPALGCDDEMNDFCASFTSCCIKACLADGCSAELLARYDSSLSSSEKEWRCYSKDALAPGTLTWDGESPCYCSAQDSLNAVQQCCLEPTTPGCDPNYYGAPIFPYDGSGGPEPVACYRIPVMIGVEQGSTLLAFAGARVLSCSDGGPKAVAYRRSTDRGLSWSPIEWLLRDPSNSSTFDGLNLGAAVVDASGAGVTLFVVNGSHTLSTAPSGVLCSIDAGGTWAAEVDWSPTTSFAQSGVNMFAGGPGAGVALPSGRLVIPGWYNWCCGQQATSADTGSALVLSDDGGATWRVGAKIG